MGKRSRRRAGEKPPVSTREYVDAQGNVLVLRDARAGGLRLEREARAGASQEDRWQRLEELRFERLAVRWTISGLPLEGQRELLARFRMADAETRRWVRATIDAHLERGP